MKRPWEEEWSNRNDRVQLEPADETRTIATFVNEGLTLEDQEADGGVDQCIARAELAAAAPDLARALLAVEWEGGWTQDSGGSTKQGRACSICGELLEQICPTCEGTRSTGHGPDCALDDALRKAGVR